MSQIVTEVYDAFRAADVDEDLAKAAAAAIAGRDDLASKLDLERAAGRLQAETVRVEADLRGEIGQVKIGLLEKIAQVETSLRAEITQVETSLRAEITKVETSLRAEIGQVKADLKLLKFAYGPIIIGLLVKLVFFP